MNGIAFRTLGILINCRNSYISIPATHMARKPRPGFNKWSGTVCRIVRTLPPGKLSQIDIPRATVRTRPASGRNRWSGRESKNRTPPRYGLSFSIMRVTRMMLKESPYLGGVLFFDSRPLHLFRPLAGLVRTVALGISICESFPGGRVLTILQTVPLHLLNPGRGLRAICVAGILMYEFLRLINIPSVLNAIPFICLDSPWIGRGSWRHGRRIRLSRRRRGEVG